MLDEPLQVYMDWLLATHGQEVDFVVLYGSRARGSRKRHSDYDLLIGLKASSQLRFIDRLLDFMPAEHALMEPKPFTPAELENLWFHYARTLLDPLFEGVVLLDRGGWAEYQRRFQAATAAGILERQGRVWIWHKDREPPASPRLAV